jgi:hypothetical protein
LSGPREAPATHFPLLLIALLSGIARPMDGFKNRRLEKAVLEIWRKRRDQFRIRADACIGS